MTVPPLSARLKPMVAPVLFVGFAGKPVNDLGTPGDVVSIVHDRVTGVLRLPAMSFALT